jgi:hypothetical protein
MPALQLRKGHLIGSSECFEWSAQVSERVLHVRFGSMLSKKSPRTSCRIRIRNNRIGANGFLSQRCALAPDLESILRARISKIVFRQYRS